LISVLVLVERRAGERLEQSRANAQLALERDHCVPDFTVTVRGAVGRKFSDVQAQLLDYEADARDFVFELPQEEVGVVVHVGSAAPAFLKRNAVSQVSGTWNLLSRNAGDLPLARQEHYRPYEDDSKVAAGNVPPGRVRIEVRRARAPKQHAAQAAANPTKKPPGDGGGAEGFMSRATPLGERLPSVM